jgi:hypothetical protein
MREKIVFGFCILMSLGFAIVGSASSLPADGGDPGKAYKACIDSVAKPDKAKMIELCFTKDDPWLKGKNLGYFTDSTFQVEVRQEWPALRLIDAKISGGKIEGDTADILVEGTMILQRLEPTNEIVEVDRSKVKGSVKMRRTNGVWAYAGEQKLEKVQ